MLKNRWWGRTEKSWQRTIIVKISQREDSGARSYVKRGHNSRGTLLIIVVRKKKPGCVCLVGAAAAAGAAASAAFAPSGTRSTLGLLLRHSLLIRDFDFQFGFGDIDQLPLGGLPRRLVKKDASPFFERCAHLFALQLCRGQIVQRVARVFGHRAVPGERQHDVINQQSTLWLLRARAPSTHASAR